MLSTVTSVFVVTRLHPKVDTTLYLLFQGMDLYFQRHDGQAVTCEDFFAAMRDANDADLSNFLLWYIACCPDVCTSLVSCQ